MSILKAFYRCQMISRQALQSHLCSHGHYLAFPVASAACDVASKRVDSGEDRRVSRVLRTLNLTSETFIEQQQGGHEVWKLSENTSKVVYWHCIAVHTVLPDGTQFVQPATPLRCTGQCATLTRRGSACRPNILCRSACGASWQWMQDSHQPCPCLLCVASECFASDYRWVNLCL